MAATRDDEPALSLHDETLWPPLPPPVFKPSYVQPYSSINMAQLLSMQSRYLERFGKKPVGPNKNNLVWLQDQLDNAEHILEIQRLRKQIGAAQGSCKPYAYTSKAMKYMTHEQVIRFLHEKLRDVSINRKPPPQPQLPQPQPPQPESHLTVIQPSSSTTTHSTNTTTVANSNSNSNSSNIIHHHSQIPIIVYSSSDSSIDTFEFEEIIGKKIEKNLPLYHVVWSDGSKSWEPIEHFSDVQHVLKYEAFLEAEKKDCGGRIQLPNGKPPHCTGRTDLCDRHRAIYEEVKDRPKKKRKLELEGNGIDCDEIADSLEGDEILGDEIRDNDIDEEDPRPSRTSKTDKLGVLRPRSIEQNLALVSLEQTLRRIGMADNKLAEFMDAFPVPSNPKQVEYVDKVIEIITYFEVDRSILPTAPHPVGIDLSNDDDIRFSDAIIKLLDEFPGCLPRKNIEDMATEIECLSSSSLRQPSASSFVSASSSVSASYSSSSTSSSSSTYTSCNSSTKSSPMDEDKRNRSSSNSSPMDEDKRNRSSRRNNTPVSHQSIHSPSDEDAHMQPVLFVRCQVCLQDCSVLQAINCRTHPHPDNMDLDLHEEKHHICNACLEHMVESWSNRDARDVNIQRVSGLLQCQTTGCNGFFEEQDIATHTSPQVFRKYVENRMRIASAQKAEVCEAEFKDRLDKELVELDDASVVSRHIDRLKADVFENVLPTKCPSCNQHFDGFVGCFALQCDGYVDKVGRVGCGSYFCGWCFELFKTEDEAHSHLLGYKCKSVIPVKRRSKFFEGRLYGSSQDYNTAVKERRMRLLRDFLAKLQRPVKAALLDALKPHLKGVLPTYYFSYLFPKRYDEDDDAELPDVHTSNADQ